MYTPAYFRARDDEAVRAVLAATEFAPVVSASSDGLDATHLPLHYWADRGRWGMFGTHVAKANRCWRRLEGGDEVLVICQGAHGYISPAWYRGRGVPTWDYVAVHAYCTVQRIGDRDTLEQLLATMMQVHESRTGTAARYQDYPCEYRDDMIKAIVGVELGIERIEATFKLSQNRSAADRESVCEHLRARDNGPQSALADYIERFAPIR